MFFSLSKENYEPIAHGSLRTLDDKETYRPELAITQWGGRNELQVTSNVGTAIVSVIVPERFHLTVMPDDLESRQEQTRNLAAAIQNDPELKAVVDNYSEDK